MDSCCLSHLAAIIRGLWDLYTTLPLEALLEATAAAIGRFARHEFSRSRDVEAELKKLLPPLAKCDICLPATLWGTYSSVNRYLAVLGVVPLAIQPGRTCVAVLLMGVSCVNSPSLLSLQARWVPQGRGGGHPVVSPPPEVPVHVTRRRVSV